MDLPQAPQGDLTLPFLRDPYRTLARISDQLGSDAFRGRLMMRETVFLTGTEGARIFYSDAMRRAGAAPRFLTATLFGHGGVQGLDGDAHRRRKAAFMALLGPDAAQDLATRIGRALDRLAAERPARIVLQDEMERLLTREVCAWAGVPVDEADLPRRAKQLADLFLHAVPRRPGYAAALLSRQRCNTWAAELVGATRRGDLVPPKGSVLAEVAFWKGADGLPLERPVAAVELLNILRPVVAISAFFTFMAHAVETHESAETACREMSYTFVREVRRTAPFFPVLAAITDRPTEILGAEVPEGMRVMLDIYGTNHDARSFARPTMFRPSRFQNRQVGPMEMIPQGGGDHFGGHRCAGEWVTEAVMEAFADWLGHRVRYEVPKQNMELVMTRLPALPASRMILTDLRPTGYSA